MNVKQQKLSRNTLSENIAQLYKLLETAEWIVEESDEMPTTDYKYVYVKNKENTHIPDEYKDLVKEGYTSNIYQNLYLEIFKSFIHLTKTVLVDEGYAKMTRDTEIEYMLVLLKSGDFALFEGELDKVSIPLPSGIGLAHTHPYLCLFSYKDIETTSYLFEKGYIVSSVITTECSSHIARLGPFTIDDLTALKKLHKKLEKCKTLDEVVRTYTEFKSENLKLFLSVGQT